MESKNYVIGIDYGTDSVRSIIADAQTGKEISAAVHYYTRWKAGKFSDPARNQFRQHPLDYVEGLENTIKKALDQAPAGTAAQVKGIGIDTTGSTPVAVDQSGTPLSMLPEFAQNPNAMFILWKDHTAVAEADLINQTSRSWGGPDYTRYEGGIYSSEWFWAKIAHINKVDSAVKEKAFSWVEHCDWISALLTGNTDPLKLRRSRCAAGHKAMWHPEWGGLPSSAFLEKIDLSLPGIRENLYQDTYTADQPAGKLSQEWAEKLGLSQEVVVNVGTFDAHAGAVGGEIEAYTLSKVMGTSTCDMLVAPMEEAGDKLVKGICGQVDGSIMPGMLGLEAGQSAFGDIYAWFARVLAWPLENLISKTSLLDDSTRHQLIEEAKDQLIARLSEQAALIPAGSTDLVALDWMNGRRTPDANQNLKGALMGLTLGSDAPRIFRALVEATCFGSRKIVDRFLQEGVPIKQVVALGGVAKKSPFVMQTMADVLNMPIKVAKSDQTPALGAAMYATVVAGIHTDMDTAKKAMGAGFDAEYHPQPPEVDIYEKLYQTYNSFGHFIEANS